MQKSDAARIIAGLTPAETKQSSAPTSVHVMSGEVVGNSESGKVQIRMDGDVVSPNDDQIIEIDALGGLEEGDTATILLTGQPGRAMTPMVMGSSGSVDRIVERIKTIEADYIKATEIEAEVATFGYLKASELETEVGKFGYLKANQLEAEVATFGYLKADDLEAEVAEFGYLKANSATITDLQADTAKIHNLSANDISAATGYIHDLTSGNVTAQNIIADHGTIVNLDSNYAHIRNGVIDNAKIGYADVNGLNANYAHIDNGVIDNATISYADVDDLDANYAHISNGVIDNATIDHADINGLDTNYAHIDNGVIDNATISYADVDDLDANYAHISNGVIDNAKIGYADVNGLNANYAQIDMANVNNAWIANGLIKDAAIKSEMVESISANQLTAGEIDADEITVRNLQASSLTVQTADGYVYVGEKRIPTKEFIDSLKDELQNEIDGAIETFTVSAVPTLNNTPANAWVVSGDAEATRKLRAKHVGDIAYVVNSSSAQNGYCYRFAYDATAQEFKWVLIKDSDVTAALSRLTTAEGKITGLETFESNTTTWMNETDDGLETIRTNHTNLSGRVDKTVVETKQLWFTKANTTAPNKPTTEVTSTSTAGNAWRVVVPAWNASYPNYYYCLQYKLADGTYAWSDVVRDIAMGESQQQGRKGVADAATADGKAVSAQNTANANIKSSVQLWFTKSNSTAPDKPTAQVTTNSASTTNAWNLAIPTYNSSYPHYFYCYQQQKGDGTYQWSDVVYDRSVTEAQAKAQAALPSSTFTTFQSTTFKNLVDTVGEQSSTITQLSDSVSSVGNILEGTVANPSNWIVSAPSGASYTKEAYGTAGVKVTFNSVGGFEWLYSQPIAVTSGNKYMVFFDYTVGKTYTTTSGKSGYGLVAYSGSNAPSGSYDDGNARFLGKAEFSKTASGDRVLKGSFTFTATSNSIVLGLNGGQIADNQTGLSFTIDNLVVGETLSTTSTTVNQVKQTATDNSAHIGNLTTTLGINADGTQSSTAKYKYNQLDQTLDGTISRVGATETKLETISNPNLTPYFSHKQADVYNATDNTDGYWVQSSADGSPSYITAWDFEQTTSNGDGWAHLKANNTTNVTLYAHAYIHKDALKLKPSTEYTFLVEWVDVTVSGTVTVFVTTEHGGTNNINDDFFTTTVSTAITAGSGSKYLTATTRASLQSGSDKRIRTHIHIPVNASVDGYIRISLYEGKYDGQYKPYVDQSLSSRVSQAETSIEQNADDIKLKATKTEAYQLSQPNLSPFFSMAPYRTATSYDGVYWQPTAQNWLMGGVTKLSDGWAHVTRGASTSLEVAIPRIESLSAGDKATLMIEWRNVTVTGSPNIYARNYPENCQFNLNSYKVTWTSNSETNGSKLIIMTVNSTATGDKTWNAAIDLGMSNGSGVSFDGDLRISLYEGEYDGPYKPYVDQSLIERVSTAETSIEQTANNVLIKATKSDTTAAQGGQHLIQSLINVAPDGVKIAADKVNIEGAAIFTSGRLSSTSLNNAYDAKGSASAVQQNLDNLQVGGRNLVWDTAWNDVAHRWHTWGSPTTREIVEIGGKRWLHLVSTAASFQGYEQGYSYRPKDDEIVAGDEVTVSVTAYAASACKTSLVGFHWINSSNTIVSQAWPSFDVTTAPQRFHATFTVPSGATRFNIMVGDGPAGVKELWISEVKFEKGNRATDWTPAPEDVDSSIAAAQSTANSAIKRSQRIYYRSSTDQPPTSMPTAWVTESGNKWAANRTTATNWTTKVTPISNGTGASVTKYLYLWTCLQYQLADGSAPQYTTVLLDDSTTVIDGGKVITGSLKANAVDANSGTFDTALIPQLTSEHIDVSTISIGDLSGSIGGRNLFAESLSLPTSKWVYDQNATRGDNVATLAANANSRIYQLPAYGYWSWEPNTDYVISVEAKASASGGKITFNMVGAGGAKTKSIDITTSWARYSWAFTSDATVSTGSASIYNGNANGTVQLRMPKLERGNRATDWTPAPEDQTAYADSVGAQSAQPNLSPLTQADLKDVYNATTNPDGYWRTTPATWYTQLDDGWIHVYKNNASGTAAVNTTAFRPKACPSIVQGQTYTILIEVRNNHSTGSGATDMYIQQTANNQFWGSGGGNIQPLTLGETAVIHSRKVADSAHITSTPVEMLRYNVRCAAGDVIDFEFRLSLYEGEYDGPFKPYVSPRSDVTDAAKTATTYLTDGGSNGLMVHPSNDANTGVRITDKVDIVRAGTSVAEYGSTTRVGKEDETHFEVDYHSLQLIDKEGNTYFHVSDLRGTDGTAEIVDWFYGDGSTKMFLLSLEASNTNYSVSVTGPSVGTVTKNTAYVSFSTAPALNSTIKVTYTTTHVNAKGYTFGIRGTGNIGALSVAEGYNTIAGGPFSHAEGFGTEASGYYSHAEGHGTTASGFYSHAEGSGTIASGNRSHAQNSDTIASYSSSTAMGKHNIDGDYALMIGNGTSDTARSNALTVDWSGNLVIAGGITLGTALTAAQIPSLAASKITSGTFAAARIPNLAASKITSGTFAAARIPAATSSTAGAVTLPTALYSGTAKGSFTLTSSAANYTRLRVFFTAANGGNGSVDVYSPDDSKFSCATTCLANDTTLQHEFAQWTISGTSVMWLNAGYVNLNVGTSIGGSVTKLTTTTNQIAITRVEGWTW